MSRACSITLMPHHSLHVNPLHGMYRIAADKRNGVHEASIVALPSIRCSIYLYIVFGQVALAQWSSSNVLKLCERFYVNPFTDRHTYGTII